MDRFILASTSPRRQELFRLLTDRFDILSPAVKEVIDPALSPAQIPVSLAEQKGECVFRQQPDAIVVSADTIVCLDHTILGKPTDAEDAFRMLRMLSGRTHTVYTGVSIFSPQGHRAFVCETQVEFFALEDAVLRAYIATGDSMDKAGAYGIQGSGCLLVRGIRGDFFNVMGLPVSTLAQTLKSMGIPVKFFA